MFCSNCGSELHDGDVLCTKCGFEVEKQKPESSENKEAGEDISEQKTELLETVKADQSKEYSIDAVDCTGVEVYAYPTFEPDKTAVMPAVSAEEPDECARVYQQSSADSPNRSASSSKALPITITIVVGVVIVALIAACAIYFTSKSSNEASINAAKQANEATQSKDSEKKSDDKASTSDSNQQSSSDSNEYSDIRQNLGKASGTKTGFNNTYVINDSDIRYLSRSDLSSMSGDEICLAQNEIWARHGRMFKNDWLQNYFNSKSWYRGTIAPDDFLNQYRPTDIENENASLMFSVLSERGYDVNSVHPN